MPFMKIHSEKVFKSLKIMRKEQKICSFQKNENLCEWSAGLAEQESELIPMSG